MFAEPPELELCDELDEEGPEDELEDEDKEDTELIEDDNELMEDNDELTELIEDDEMSIQYHCAVGGEDILLSDETGLIELGL